MYVPPHPDTPPLGHVPVMRPPGAGAASQSYPAATAATAAAGSQPDGQLGLLLHMHPLAAVSMDDVAAGVASCSGLSLMPSEALQLYDAMVQAVQAVQAGNDSTCAGDGSASGSGSGSTLSCFGPLHERLTELEPGAFLGPSAAGGRPAPLVTRPAAKAWASQLLQLLETWARAGGEFSAAAQAVARGLSGDARHTLGGYEEAWGETQAGAAGKTPHGPSAQASHLMQLLLRMRDAGMLPAIHFNFDRRWRGGLAACAHQACMHTLHAAAVSCHCSSNCAQNLALWQPLNSPLPHACTNVPSPITPAAHANCFHHHPGDSVQVPMTSLPFVRHEQRL